jgi:hypothetical protein
MLLAIYLNDHLAGSTTASAMVKRAARSNHRTEYGSFLDRLGREIDEDRESLVSIMRALGVRVDRLKMAGAWCAEKLARLKLNGRLIGYSPLSRVVELEFLALGVTGKLALWRGLETLQSRAPELAGFDLEGLKRRADRQQTELEEHRLRAVAEAFANDFSRASSAAMQ